VPKHAPNSRSSMTADAVASPRLTWKCLSRVKSGWSAPPEYKRSRIGKVANTYLHACTAYINTLATRSCEVSDIIRGLHVYEFSHEPVDGGLQTVALERAK
jgi:hypothetical protein